MKTTLSRAAGAIAIAVFLRVSAQAQDFQHSYAVGAGGRVRVGNISGDVLVTGYNGDTIMIGGYTEGRDWDRVRVVDLSAAARVDVGVTCPTSSECAASVG